MNDKFHIISIEELESISSGDKEFMKELIQIFLDQVPEYTFNMKKFFAEGNLKSLAKEAHTAKSSVLIFGMTSTGTSLKVMQLQAECKNMEQLQSLIDKVELEMNNAADQLKEIMKTL
jgi:HPt (histidine-containing phosphotransfer) domain-containing protein